MFIHFIDLVVEVIVDEQPIQVFDDLQMQKNLHILSQDWVDFAEKSQLIFCNIHSFALSQYRELHLGMDACI